MEPTLFETPDGLSAKIEIPAGMVTIEARDEPTTEVEVVRAKDPEALTVRLDDAPGGGHRLLIEYEGKRFGSFSSHEVVLVIRCPSGSTMEMASGSADLTVRGALASLAFRTGSGDLSFDDTAGDVTVKLASGDVLGGYVGGSFTMAGASGDVRLAGVGGNLTARTASGDIDAGAVDGDVTIHSVSGQVVIGSLLRGATQIRSVSGDVRIGIAAGTDVRLELNATSGDVRSDLDMVEAPSGQARMLELSVVTVSGDVQVMRAPARDHV